MSILVLLILMNPSQPAVEDIRPLEFQGNPGGIYCGAIKGNRVFLAFPSSGTVLCFDLNGKALNPIGRKGQGPGEFNWPSVLCYSDPYLYVCDTGQDKLHRINPDTGTFLKSWPIKGVTAMSVKTNELLVAFVDPSKSNVFATVTLGDEPKFQKPFGMTPCCLDVSGSHKGAALHARDGSLWVAFTGEYQLQKFSADARLIKSITSEPPDFTAPSQPKNISRYDTGALSANVMSYDKIQGLFELNGQILLYRYKTRGDSYIDVYNTNGNRLSSFRSDGIKPLCVVNETFYVLRASEEKSSKSDLMLAVMTIN